MPLKRVYIFSGQDRCKIGISAFPVYRLETMQVGAAEDLKLVYFSDEFENARTIERVAHKLLKDHRIKGEWFKVSEQLATETIKKSIDIVSKGEDKFILAPTTYEHSRMNFSISREDQILLIQIASTLSLQSSKSCSLAKALRIMIREKAVSLNIS